MIDKPRKGDNGVDLPLQEYFDALPGIVSVQDRDLRIVRTNYRLREFFGDPGDTPATHSSNGARTSARAVPWSSPSTPVNAAITKA